ncbi:MAG: DUF349 domain-containing protein [Betaproteobacteria bacterium]
MALLDRFRTQSRYKHADPMVRLEAIAEVPIDDRELITAIAREDEDPRVRRAAAAKLLDPAALAQIAREDGDESVRAQAAAMLRDIALDAFEGLDESQSLAAVDALADSKALVQVAKSASRDSIALAALARIADGRARASIARHAAADVVRLAAFEGVADRSDFVDVALNSEFKDTALLALERLSERADLEQVAARAKNRSASKRARAILREQDERAAAEAAAAAPPPPDPAETARGERMQIVQRLEALGAFEALEAAAAELEQAEAAWASIDGAPDALLAARFATVAGTVGGRIAELRDRAARADAEAERARRREEQATAERMRAAAEADEAARAAAEKERERRLLRMAELVPEAEAAAADEELSSARRRLALVQHEWRDLCAGIVVDTELGGRFAAAEARLAARDSEAHEAEARARRDGLHRMTQLLARVEPLAARADLTLKAGERALRDIRAALGDVPPLPSKQDFEDVSRRLKAAAGALTPKVQELRDADEWRRFANVAIQEQLCARMEALKALEDPEEIARQIRDLQQQWRQAADVPRAQAETLWHRFKAAHDEAWARCEAYFASQNESRRENLEKKLALCERAEALADSTNWIQTAEAIKTLQAEWKAIGPVTRGQEKAVWERFRTACDRFFTRRHDDLAERKKVWAENLAGKVALCERAEALADSTEWDAVAAELKQLQAEWKTIGPVKKNRSEAIWLRFRTACDRFFSRYAHRYDIALAERIAAREAICAELEALGGGDETGGAEPPPDLLNAVRGIRGRWQQQIAGRGVDRDHAVALDKRFAAAFSRLVSRWPAAFANTDLDPDTNRRRMETLVRRIEDLAASLTRGNATTGEDSLSPTTRLAAMLKEALAANTIGGKVDEDSRWRAAAEDVRQAQAAWSRIGPVPEDLRRALGDRFQRASRRIMERAGAAGRSSAPRRPTGS